MIIVFVTLSVLFLLSIATNIFLYRLVSVLLKKITIYENEIIKSDTLLLTIQNNIIKSLEIMREIDKQGVFSSRISEKGLFESDDMVGQIFIDLTQTVDDLSQVITKLNEKK